MARPAERGDSLDRLVPQTGSTTGVYRTTTNGQPSGLIVLQVAGPALLLEGTATLFQFSIYSSGDLSQPPAAISYGYEGRRGDRWLSFGTRGTAGFEEIEPPQPIFELPLRRGRTFSWSGKIGNDPAKQKTTVVETKTLNVLGRRIADCVHTRAELEREALAGRTATTTDRWDCPDIGQVRGTIAGKNPESSTTFELAEFHGPGLDLVGPGTSILARADAGDGAVPGETVGIDASRARHVPEADLDLTGPSWSITRTAAMRFPPVGRRDLVVLAEEDGTVSATNPRTGKISWSIRVSAPVVAPPVAAGETVLVAAADKTLLALDAATGAARWMARLPDLVSAAPLVVDGTVVVAVEDRSVRALRISDGATVWTTNTRALVLAPPARAGDTVVLGDSMGTLLAVSARDGGRRWSESLEGPLVGGPVQHGDLGLAADDQGTLTAYDAVSGSVEWTARTDGVAASAPAVAPDTVVMVTEGPSRLEAFDARGGARRWSRPLRRVVDAPPLVLGDTVVLLSRSGRLITYALADGRVLGDTELPRPERGTRISAATELSFVDGSLVATARLGRPWELTSIVAFPASASAARGGVTFRGTGRPVPAHPSGMPVLDGDDVFLPSADGRLWRVTRDGTSGSLAESGQAMFFVVRAGELFLTQTAPEGEGLAQLVALTRDGRRSWSAAMGLPKIGTAPAVAGRTVVVPIQGLGLQGVDTGSGKPKWSRPIVGGTGSSTPLVLPGGDVVYAVGSLGRYDAATGAVRWTRQKVNAFGPLAYDDGTVFGAVQLGVSEFVLLAADARTGEANRRVPLELDLAVGPAIAGGTVVSVDGAGVVVGRDPRSLDARWALTLRNRALATPVVVGDRVVVAEEGWRENLLDREYRVVALDAATGRFLGSLQPGGSVFTSKGAFGATDDVLFVPALRTGAPRGALLLVRMAP